MLDTDLAAPIPSTDPHNSLFFPLSPPHTLWFSFSPFLFVSLVLSLSPFSFGLGHLFLLLPYAIRHSVCVYLPPVTHLPHALFSACHSYPRRSVSALADDTRHHLYVILVLSVFFSPFVLLFTLTVRFFFLFLTVFHHLMLSTVFYLQTHKYTYIQAQIPMFSYTYTYITRYHYPPPSTHRSSLWPGTFTLLIAFTPSSFLSFRICPAEREAGTIIFFYNEYIIVTIKSFRKRRTGLELPLHCNQIN